MANQQTNNNSVDQKVSKSTKDTKNYEQEGTIGQQSSKNTSNTLGQSATQNRSEEQKNHKNS